MEDSAVPNSVPTSISPSQTAAIRVLLLIESANGTSPQGEHLHAKVLRADQLRPDQIRAASREASHEAYRNSSLDSSSTRSSLPVERDVDANSEHIETDSFEANHFTQNSEIATADLSKSDLSKSDELMSSIGEVGDTFSTHSGGALPPPEDVAPSGCGDGIEVLQRCLLGARYELQILGSNLTPHALHDALRDETPPEVVVLEASRDVSVVAARCHEVKSEALCAMSSLLVVLPPTFVDSPNAPQTVAQLMAAGADDFLHCEAPEHEFEARLKTLATLSRTRRELQQTQEKLRDLMQTDELTHLLRRRFFFQMAHREYERASRYAHNLSCLMIDINYFRRIAETMGFACGDAVLRHLAQVLRDVTREVDIVARFSEHKFVALLPESDMDMAEKIGDLIEREVAHRTFSWQGNVLPLSVSVGAATRRGEALSGAATEDIEYSNKQLPGANAAKIESENAEVANAEIANADAQDDSFTLHEAVASLLEEADAALFVAKRGMRNTWMETPLASPLAQPQ